MQYGRKRERLLIGEVAGILGITPKAVRHYEKLGLLGHVERSESGYRLYTADDLMRLHRIKRLQTLGLSLERIKAILDQGVSGTKLRRVLETLLGEVESQLTDLERRRDRLKVMLAGENFKEPDDEPYALKLAHQHLGDQLRDVSPELLEQEKRLWGVLEAFGWPEGYREFQEILIRYLADHPEEYEKLLGLGERFAALVGVSEDSYEVELLARDYAAYFEKNSFHENLLKEAGWGPGPMGIALSKVMLSTMSPAQKRCMELTQRLLSEKGNA
jgi:DNA-binding transcriptional MerR regulator